MIIVLAMTKVSISVVGIFFETSFCSDSLPNDENLINDIRGCVSRNNAVPMNSVNDLLKTLKNYQIIEH